MNPIAATRAPERYFQAHGGPVEAPPMKGSARMILVREVAARRPSYGRFVDSAQPTGWAVRDMFHPSHDKLRVSHLRGRDC